MNHKFVSGLIIGAVAGAALALFLNTEKGKEIIEDIKDITGDAADKAKAKLSDLKDELTELLGKGRAIVEDLEQKANEATS